MGATAQRERWGRMELWGRWGRWDAIGTTRAMGAAGAFGAMGGTGANGALGLMADGALHLEQVGSECNTVDQANVSRAYFVAVVYVASLKLTQEELFI